MCTVSMIMDHYGDEWRRRYFPTPQPIFPQRPFIPPTPLPTQGELDEFRRLLDRARDYDRRNNEPDCEVDVKRRLLKDMADKLGVDISFIDEPSRVAGNAAGSAASDATKNDTEFPSALADETDSLPF